MTVSYTGKLELYQNQQDKLEVKYAKISKMLEAAGKGDRQAHVILNRSRGQHQVEITVNYLDHSLIGAAVDGEQYNALLTAVEHLEKQIIKIRDRRRDSKSAPKEIREQVAAASTVAAEPAKTVKPAKPAKPAAAANGKRPQVFEVAPDDHKPMTVDEAVLHISKDETYFVYMDAATDRLSVLLRRPDGNFDLVQC